MRLAQFAYLASLVTAQSSHPTLPTMWVSTTKEPGAPGDEIGVEAYYFVDQPTEDNPSALWSNYTGCQRLIYDDSQVKDTRRYLLGCDGGLDCCWEQQEGDQVEFQIPNVHPSKLAHVTHNGTKPYSNFGRTVTADQWDWHFTVERFQAFTTPNASQPTNVSLVSWHVEVDTPVAIEFGPDFQGIPESERQNFKQMFQIPQVCRRNNLLPCSNEASKKWGPSPVEKLMMAQRRARLAASKMN